MASTTSTPPSAFQGSSPRSLSSTELVPYSQGIPENQLEYFFECGCIREDGHDSACILSMAGRDWTDIELLALARAVEDVDPGSNGDDIDWDHVDKEVIFEDDIHGGPILMRDKMRRLTDAVEVSRQISKVIAVKTLTIA